MYKKMILLLTAVIGFGSTNCFATNAKNDAPPSQNHLSFFDAPYPISISNAFLAHPAEIAKVIPRFNRPCYAIHSHADHQTATTDENNRSGNSANICATTIPFQDLGKS